MLSVSLCLCEKQAAYATPAQLTRNALTESLRHGVALHLQLNELPWNGFLV